jgi:hypothetical protein
MIPAGKDTLYFTIFDAHSNIYETKTITESTDIRTLQELIKEKYKKIVRDDEH